MPGSFMSAPKLARPMTFSTPSGRIGRVPTILSSSFLEVDAIAELPSRYFQTDIAIMEQDRRACNAGRSMGAVQARAGPRRWLAGCWGPALAFMSFRDQQQQSLAAQIVSGALAADETFRARDGDGVGPVGPVAGIGRPIPVLAAVARRRQREAHAARPAIIGDVDGGGGIAELGAVYLPGDRLVAGVVPIGRVDNRAGRRIPLQLHH